MGHPRPLCHLFSLFFKQTSIQFYKILMRKNIRPIYGTGIRTHYPQNASLLLLTLDQGSRPIHSLVWGMNCCCFLTWKPSQRERVNPTATIARLFHKKSSWRLPKCVLRVCNRWKANYCYWFVSATKEHSNEVKSDVHHTFDQWRHKNDVTHPRKGC